MTTTRRRALAGLALGLAVTLAACAPSVPTAQGPSDAPEASETAAAEPAATPKERPVAEPDPAPADDPATQDAALDTLVASLQGQITMLQESTPGVYQEIRITAVHPGGIEYTYVFADQVDVASSTAYFDEMVATFQGVADGEMFPGMADAGIVTSQQVIYTYLNPDGSTIWTYTFEPTA